MAISCENSPVAVTLRVFVIGFVVLSLSGRPVAASDPELTSDFGINVTSGEDLKFTGFHNLTDQPFDTISILIASNARYPGVTGLGLSPAILKFGPNALNSIHSHPRANEVFYLFSGELDVGVIDNRNRLFTTVLKGGEVFVFPRGLLHFQRNRSKTRPVTAIAVFNSENGGRDSIAPAVFNSEPRISSEILQRAFQLDAKTIERLTKFDFTGPLSSTNFHPAAGHDDWTDE